MRENIAVSLQWHTETETGILRALVNNYQYDLAGTHNTGSMYFNMRSNLMN
jgi:hypothetical protein